MQIRDIITPERITSCMSVSSKKRVFEKISTLLRDDEVDLDQDTVFHSLVERERLGSTCIGNGVALPHGRVKGLKKPVGAFATLAQDIDYDALDGEPIKMVFALLVPEDTNEEHLRALAALATILRDQDLCDRLLGAKSSQEIYHLLTNCNDVTNRKVG
ncbi:MAG: PTS IIA-like nitrogen regulatory protein PtsN [Acidiferrobacterales bacterium]